MKQYQFFTSFVVYVDQYNFSQSLLEAFVAYVQTNFEYWEIILINECDKHQNDRTPHLNNLTKISRSLMLFNSYKFYGRSESIADASLKSIGDIVFYIDYLHDKISDSVSAGVDAINAGYDIVSYQYKKSYITSILTRRSINKITNRHKKISSRNFIYNNSGFKYKVIVIKDNLSVKLEPLLHRYLNKINTATMYTKIPVLLALVCASFFIFFLVAVLAYIIIIYLHQRPVPGWTSIMLVMTASFAAVFSLFFIVLNYLSLITQNLIYKNDDYQVKYEVIND